jgi:hypothetical protein
LENIRDALTSNNHHAFPLINSRGKLVGLMPRNFIIVLIKQRGWYSETPALFSPKNSKGKDQSVDINKSIGRDSMISKYQENNKALGESMISQNKYSTKSDLKTI